MTLSEVANIGYFFLQDIPDFTVASPGIGEGASVNVTVDGEEILDETLYGDGAGNINMRDMTNMLLPYISSGMHTVNVNDSSFRVFYNRDEIREIATDYNGLVSAWIESHFLSNVQEHLVSADETVKLWLMSTTAKKVTIKLSVVYLDNHMPKTATNEGEVTLSADSPFELTTSLDSLSKLVSSEVIAAKIEAGSRICVLHRRTGKESVMLKYDNTFGLTEYVSLQGVLKEKPQYEFTTSLIYSRTKNVNIDEKRIYEFNTSAITESTLAKIKDAIRAENVQLIRGDRAFDIVFDSADLAYSDDKSDLQGVTFSFFRAINNRQTIEDVDTDMLYRIFSDQFNETFN